MWSSYLVPWVLLTRVLPTSLTLKIDGAFTSYQSLRVNGSTIFFLAPFLPAFRPYSERNEGKNKVKEKASHQSITFDTIILGMKARTK